MDTISRKASHNAKVRDAVLDAAAPLFRSRGYDGVGIDALMQAAGLTRGAFYAHFKSKAALFAAVLKDRHPLLARLKVLPDGDRAGLSALFEDYLAPAHLAQVAPGYTLVALSGDAARQSAEARAGFGAARAEIQAQMVRAGAEPTRADVALSLATGALQAAAADADPVRQAAVLHSANQLVQELL